MLSGVLEWYHGLEHGDCEESEEEEGDGFGHLGCVWLLRKQTPLDGKMDAE